MFPIAAPGAGRWPLVLGYVNQHGCQPNQGGGQHRGQGSTLGLDHCHRQFALALEVKAGQKGGDGGDVPLGGK